MADTDDRNEVPSNIDLVTTDLDAVSLTGLTNEVTSSPSTKDGVNDHDDSTDGLSDGEKYIGNNQKFYRNGSMISTGSHLINDHLDNKQVNGKDKVHHLNGSVPATSSTQVSVDVDDGDNPNSYVQDEPEVQTESGKKKQRGNMVGFFQLFRFASCLDIVFMIIGMVTSLLTGLAFPMNLLIYGDVATLFVEYQINENILAGNASLINTTSIDVFSTVAGKSIYFVLIAVIVTFTAFMQMFFWHLTASRQVKTIRSRYFNSVMRQDMAWFDQRSSGELATILASDLHTLEAGIGEKVATFLQWSAGFVGGYSIAFAKSWKLTLVALSLSPFLAVFMGGHGKIATSFAQKESKYYAKAGGIAEEAIRAIRTVVAFYGEEKEVKRYTAQLKSARWFGILKGVLQGVSQGLVWTTVFGMFALAFWYGGTLVQEGSMEAGNVLQVIFGVLVGSMSLGHAMPNLEAFANARGAAYKIYQIIDRKSEIDPDSEDGEIPKECNGNIELEDVEFSYPTRPDVKVMKGINLNISVGKTVALVGPSGSGKSTVVQLIQRFYDPRKGKVKLDGRDICSLNVHWLRNQIGVVSQEPVLFSGTIAENIKYGRENVTQADIEMAAREANAHDFIKSLPDQYETEVGHHGSQLSGGQKQRIAIARALVRNPKILLLDEATSALDNESEAIVQAALEKASKGRTTVVVAHRLSTVRNSDMIIGIKNGTVVEKGTYDELMKKQGLFYELAISQMQHGQDKYDEVSLLSEKEDLPLLKRHLSSGSRRSSRLRGSFRRQMSEISSVEDMEEEEVVEAAESVPLLRIFRMNSPEWPFLLTGSLASIFTGALFPSFAVLFSEILGTFAIIDPDVMKSQISLFGGMMALIGLIAGLASILENYCFSRSGEELTQRLRTMAFHAILRQEIGWFDDPVNSIGSLTARLASDASHVKGATGTRLSVIIQSVASIGSAVIIAFVVAPILACVAMCFLPLMIITGILQSKVITGIGKGGSDETAEAGQVASEAFDNIRTVAALTREKSFEEKYENLSAKIYGKSKKAAVVFGVVYGISQCVVFFAYATIFPFGSWLVNKRMMEFKNVFRVFGCVVFGGQGVGRAAGMAPGFERAKASAAHLFSLLDREPSIDSASTEGKILDNVSGEITMKSVSFEYPARANMKVLKNFSLSIEPGQKMALVGMSGCGKSTTVQLIERFYDPVEGQVNLDGHDIRMLNLQWLRKQIGIVSQEPILFDYSIRENIAYGDNSREVPVDEIISAARKANIHEFIASLPQGYETNVGEKGAQLSGGQKQRISIARALVRNPKILLLDEATSALDMESEKVVQAALDVAQEGRTCVIIAHRLATVQNSDVISVIQNGQVVEEGSHKELLREGGIYYKLANMHS